MVTHRGPLTVMQRWWVAIIHVGQGCALASLTALEAAGLDGFSSQHVHVVVANGSRVHSLPWVKVHVSRRFGPDDVHPASTPPRCRTARAAIDAASWKVSAKAGCALLAAVVQQRMVTAAQLSAQLENAGAIRHKRILRSSLFDIAGGSQALSEIDLVRLCRKAGLPKPDQQVVRKDSSGRRRYLDARFVRPDGRVILIEVDGAVHMRVDHWWDDQRRSNDLVLTEDAIILRVPAFLLRSDPRAVQDLLRRAYFG